VSTVADPALQTQPVVARLIDILGEGARRIDPPVLQPARVFAELIGEELTRRAFFTNAVDGSEWVLRPDLTIPAALEHLCGPLAGECERLCYAGLAFRQQPPGHGGEPEFLQVGMESYGASDAVAEDALLLARTMAALEQCGVRDAALVVGDIGLSLSFFEGLGIEPFEARRLTLAGARPGGVEAALVRALRAPPASDIFTRTLVGLPRADALALVEERIAAGHGLLAGRTAEQILDRLLARAQRDGAPALTQAQAQGVRAWTSIDGDARAAIERAVELAGHHGVDLSTGAAGWMRRLVALEGRPARFRAGLARPLEYYDGMVFEVHAPWLDVASGPRTLLGGGGRTDSLVGRLSRGRVEVRAAGAALRPARVLRASGGDRRGAGQ